MNFGQRCAKLRKECGYTRVTFAAKLGIPQTTLRNYELGIHEPGHSFLIQVAKEFGVTTDYLLGLTENPYKEKNSSAPVVEPETEESKLELELFRRALYDFGLLREGQNLTPSQAEIILSVVRILQVTLAETQSDEQGDNSRGVGTL